MLSLQLNGVMVELADGNVGLLRISEISQVDGVNVAEVFSLGDRVKVRNSSSVFSFGVPLESLGVADQRSGPSIIWFSCAPRTS